MNLIYWTALLWVRAISDLTTLTPLPAAGPFSTYQECQKYIIEAKSEKYIHMSCKKHSEIPKENSTGVALKEKLEACRAFTERGYSMSCDINLIRHLPKLSIEDIDDYSWKPGHCVMMRGAELPHCNYVYE